MKRTKWPEKKVKEKSDFPQIKPKDIVFYNSEKMQQMYVYLSKETLSELSSSEMAVYVVLCSKARIENNSWVILSQGMICQYTGLSRTTVNKAVQYLKERKLVQNWSRSTPGSHVQKYKVEFYRGPDIEHGKEDRDLFQFYKSIVLNGTWSKLSPSAKVLYMAMRRLSYCVGEVYTEIEEDEYKESTELGDWIRDGYNSRKWDQMSLDRFNRGICGQSGLRPKDVTIALEEVIKANLVVFANDLWGCVLPPPDAPEDYAEYENGGFKVYLRPEYNHNELKIIT